MVTLLLATLLAGWNLVAGTGISPAEYMEAHDCAAAIWEYRSEGKDIGWVRLDQPRSEIEMSQYLHQPLDPEQAYWVYCEVNDAG